MAFRMGINLGDVIVDGTNIYGDGVNLAARRELRKRRIKGRFRYHFKAYLGVIGFLAIINMLTFGGSIWVHWPALGWGLAIYLHWLRASAVH